MKTFGIGIPCHKKHLSVLPELLNSIQNSTILPDEVCISISSINEQIQLNSYTFRVTVISTSEHKNVSQNRNIVADMLQTEIISFIDSDDFSHPKRNEYLLEAFNTNNCAVVVHNFHKTLNRQDEFLKTDLEKLDLYPECIDTFQPHILPWPVSQEYGNIVYHNGHVTLYKNIFNQFRYNEHWREIGEDCDLNARIVTSGIKISYIKNKLSMYIN
jgi:glycosyltransferase involved in cell wall biosynthesis